jgi:hypothetical protein
VDPVPDPLILRKCDIHKYSNFVFAKLEWFALLQASDLGPVYDRFILINPEHPLTHSISLVHHK